jgi:hypothetical protein
MSRGLFLAFQMGMRGLRRFSVSTPGLLAAFWIPALSATYPSSPPLRLFDLTMAHSIVGEKPFERPTVPLELKRGGQMARETGRRLVRPVARAVL